MQHIENKEINQKQQNGTAMIRFFPHLGDCLN